MIYDANIQNIFYSFQKRWLFNLFLMRPPPFMPMRACLDRKAIREIGQCIIIIIVSLITIQCEKQLSRHRFLLMSFGHTPFFYKNIFLNTILYHTMFFTNLIYYLNECNYFVFKFFWISYEKQQLLKA